MHRCYATSTTPVRFIFHKTNIKLHTRYNEPENGIQGYNVTRCVITLQASTALQHAKYDGLTDVVIQTTSEFAYFESKGGHEQS